MNTRTCPYCALEVAPDATMCPSCNGLIPVGSVPTAQPPVQAPPQELQMQPVSPAPASGGTKKGLFLTIGIAVTIAVVGAVVAWQASTATSPPSAPPVPAAVNQPIRGTIDGAHPNRVYEFGITQAGPVTINAVSQFDNYLELYRGDAETPMRSDDDSGGNYNARITVNLSPGVYYALVCAYSDGRGPFTLNISAPQEPATPATPARTAGLEPATAGPPPTDAEARGLAQAFYATRSEWAGQYNMSNILRARLHQTGPTAYDYHVQYEYTCIQARCPGQRSGRDQRVFNLQRQGNQWVVTGMGAHMSATF